jgi:geranylgeranyl diphosphate synthase type I
MNLTGFSEYKKMVNAELEKFVELSTNPRAKGWERQFDNLILDYVKNSGKRLRPILGIMAYRGMGGRDIESMIRVSRSFELLHNSELIHDDIIDKSDIRRGRPTFHKAMEEWMRKNGYAKPAEDATSISILAGDYFIFMTIRSVIESNFPDDVKNEIIKIICTTAEKTIRGQILDIEFANKDIREKDYLRVVELKTAIFFEGIIKVATVASGCDKKVGYNLAKFAKNLGYAFQIKDDIIGLFGNESVIGKSVKSDVEEGKRTILMIKAKEMGSSTIRDTINGLLGKRKITDAELIKIRKAVMDSGALNYARKMMDRYLKESNKLLENIKGNIYMDTYVFLNNLMSFTVERKF